MRKESFHAFVTDNENYSFESLTSISLPFPYEETCPRTGDQLIMETMRVVKTPNGTMLSFASKEEEIRAISVSQLIAGNLHNHIYQCGSLQGFYQLHWDKTLVVESVCYQKIVHNERTTMRPTYIFSIK